MSASGGPGVGGGSTAGLVRLIANREITAKLRDRVFWVSTAFLILIVGGSVLIPALFLGDDDRPAIAVAAGPGQDEQALVAAAVQVARAAPDGSPAAAAITVSAVPDGTAAETAVRDGSVDAAVVAGPDGVVVVAEREVPEHLKQALAAASQQVALVDGLTTAGLSAEEATQALGSAGQAAPQERLLDPPADDEEAAIGLSVLFALLFFFTTFMFGMGIAQSVVEEKQGRVVELLVAAVPVRTLLTGKVLGNLALALGQVAVLLAAGTLGAALAGEGDVLRLIGRSSGWFVVFFVLGFGMFSCLWAAAGALASRQEDLQSTTVPLQALMFAPFFAAVYVSTPGTALTALSYIPFTAPLAMPRRLLLGDAELWEPFLAAGIMLATSVVFVLIATRLYERSLLRTHGRTSWREAWSAPAR